MKIEDMVPDLLEASFSSASASSSGVAKRKRPENETMGGDDEGENSGLDYDPGDGLISGAGFDNGDSIIPNIDTVPKNGTDLSDWQGRIDLVRKSKTSIKHLGKPRALRRPSIGGKWSPDEDNALRAIVEEHQPKNWKKIAKLLGPTRTDVQCLHRWNKVLKPGLHKGAWSEAEDSIVKQMVNENVGEVKWSAIAAKLPGRIGKQCRERWFNHLDPIIKRGDWSSDEDRVLYEAQKHFGNRWCEISKILPGRTENAVKNRWNSSTMRRWLKERDLTPGNGQPLEDLAQPGGLERSIQSFNASLITAGVEGIDASALLVNESDNDEEENTKSAKKSRKSKNSTRNMSNMYEQFDDMPLPPSSIIPGHLRPPGINTQRNAEDETTDRIVQMLGLIKSTPSPIGDETLGGGGRGTRRVRGRGSSTADNGKGLNNNAALSPVSRAMTQLKGSGSLDEDENAEELVPIQALPFFSFLKESAQRSIMRQLVEKFQRTHTTPRNGILPTPKFDQMNLPSQEKRAYGQTITDVTSPLPMDEPMNLGLSPRQSSLQSIDPNCFESGYGEQPYLEESHYSEGILNEISSWMQPTPTAYQGTRTGTRQRSAMINQEANDSKNSFGGSGTLAPSSTRAQHLFSDLDDSAIDVAVMVANQVLCRGNGADQILKLLVQDSNSLNNIASAITAPPTNSSTRSGGESSRNNSAIQPALYSSEEMRE